MELWLLLCCCYTFNWSLLLQKHTAFLSIFFEYKCFNSLQQSAVEARRQGGESPNSIVVVKWMKLLANDSYVYQILERSRYTVTKYLSDQKTHAAINNRMFKKLDLVNACSWTRRSTCWAHRANDCLVLQYSVRKTANVGALPQLLQQNLRGKHVRRVENGQRFAESCSCLEETRRFHQTWNENGVPEVAIKWLCQ